jgi:hypothetical protein
LSRQPQPRKKSFSVGTEALLGALALSRIADQ